jgi:putative tryptophan/tyrosine transport system substrate-binding protein
VPVPAQRIEPTAAATRDVYAWPGRQFEPTGRQITGVTLFIDVLTAKRVELLTEVAPAAALAILVNPRNPNAETEARDAQAAAQRSGREFHVLTARNEGEIDAAFAKLAQQPGAALTIGTDTFFYSRSDQLVGLAARYAIPTIYFHREFALTGGLITYGSTFIEELRTAGRARSRTTYRYCNQASSS